MAWFRNHYRCGRCGKGWSDEWSCMCDDDCPHCGARHWSPVNSEDLTYIVVPRQGLFVVLESPKSAEYEPAYSAIAATTRRAAADAIVAGRIVHYWDQ